MSERKAYEPNEAESDIINRAGVAAAFTVLQEMDDVKESLPNWTLICVRAFGATQKALKNAKNELNAKHPECEYVAHYCDEDHIVCSALFGLLLGLDKPTDIAPENLGGMKIIAFAKAIIAMAAMGDVLAAFDDDFVLLGSYMTEEVERMAKMAIATPPQ